jgi:hypothetical protein
MLIKLSKFIPVNECHSCDDKQGFSTDSIEDDDLQSQANARLKYSLQTESETMTKQAWQKLHSDYKSVKNGKKFRLKLNPKTGATELVPVTIKEESPLEIEYDTNVNPQGPMQEKQSYDLVSKETAAQVAKKLGYSFDPIQFWKGMNVEMEHKDVTKGDLLLTGKIAAAHLREVPNYYDMLEKYIEK